MTNQESRNVYIFKGKHAGMIGRLFQRTTKRVQVQVAGKKNTCYLGNNALFVGRSSRQLGTVAERALYLNPRIEYMMEEIIKEVSSMKLDVKDNEEFIQIFADKMRNGREPTKLDHSRTTVSDDETNSLIFVKS